MKSRTPKQDQERTHYDRTKRGIVMIMHTSAFAPWTIGKIRTRLHEAMAKVTDKHGIAVTPEADRSPERGWCGDHDNVIVTYAIDNNDIDVDAMLKDLNAALYDILRKPGSGLEGKLLNTEAFLDEPVTHALVPVEVLALGLILIAHDNAERRQQKKEQPVQS